MAEHAKGPKTKAQGLKKTRKNKALAFSNSTPAAILDYTKTRGSAGMAEALRHGYRRNRAQASGGQP